MTFQPAVDYFDWILYVKHILVESIDARTSTAAEVAAFAAVMASRRTHGHIWSGTFFVCRSGGGICRSNDKQKNTHGHISSGTFVVF